MTLKNQPLIYIESTNEDYKKLAQKFGVLTYDPDFADVILFTGGADVSPTLYGEAKLDQTNTNVKRDRYEVGLYHRMRQQKNPPAFIGICRGGQFLNVMNGGKLWQHVEDHGRSHHVLDMDSNKLFFCSSTHHQMMRTPVGAGMFKVLAVAGSSKNKLIEIKKDTDKYSADAKSPQDGWDIEAVWYPETRSLCFQPHPEHHGVPECTELFLKYVNDYVFQKKINGNSTVDPAKKD